MSSGECGTKPSGAARGSRCGRACTVIAHAAVIALLASTIGMADALVFRKKNLTIAAPVAPGPAGALVPGTPGGEPATGPGGSAAPAGRASPEARPLPAPSPVPATLDPNMIDLPRTVDLFERMMSVGDVRFVDARYPDEFAAGRIPSAVCLPPTKFAGTIPAEVDLLSRDATIVIYCGGGDCDASKLTALRLNELGFMHTLIFHDGFPAWVKAGHPVEK